MTIKKVALLGAGAVGAYFIWGISPMLGDDFCVIAKGDRKQRLEHEGIVINGQRYHFPVKEPSEAKDIDLLLVACKYDSLVPSLSDIQEIVNPNTIVVSLLNGVTSEEVIGSAIGKERILHSVMRISSVRKGSEIVFNPEKTGGVFLGEIDSPEVSNRMLAVGNLLKEAGLRYHYVEDIILTMWAKYASNIAQNLPQAVLNVGFCAYTDSDHVHYIASQLWREVSLIANSKGVALSPEFKMFDGPGPQQRFSTLQDLDSKRHTEIEMFCGEMIRMGKEANIPVPYCEYTYHLIKALEEKNDGKFNAGL